MVVRESLAWAVVEGAVAEGATRAATRMVVLAVVVGQVVVAVVVGSVPPAVEARSQSMWPLANRQRHHRSARMLSSTPLSRWYPETAQVVALVRLVETEAEEDYQVGVEDRTRAVLMEAAASRTMAVAVQEADLVAQVGKVARVATEKAVRPWL